MTSRNDISLQGIFLCRLSFLFNFYSCPKIEIFLTCARTRGRRSRYIYFTLRQNTGVFVHSSVIILHSSRIIPEECAIIPEESNG
nr:MAG TPA: hypothetical protein [Caudoviricetes sp.]